MVKSQNVIINISETQQIHGVQKDNEFVYKMLVCERIHIGVTFYSLSAYYDAMLECH